MADILREEVSPIVEISQIGKSFVRRYESDGEEYTVTGDSLLLPVFFIGHTGQGVILRYFVGEDLRARMGLDISAGEHLILQLLVCRKERHILQDDEFFHDADEECGLDECGVSAADHDYGLISVEVAVTYRTETDRGSDEIFFARKA